MIFERPEFLYALFGLPLILLFYLLRRPPRHVVVPHLFLWERVHKRLGRARKNRVRDLLSIVLQALIAAALILALADPRTPASKEGTLTRVYVLDVAPTMAARMSDGRTRIEAAKAAIRADLDALGAGDAAALYVFGAACEIRARPTTDHDIVRQALDAAALEPAGRPPRDPEALLAIVDAANAGTDWILFTDAAFPWADVASAPARPRIRVVNERSDNAGVTDLRARSSVRGLELEVETVNATSSPARLLIEGDGLSRELTALPPNQERSARSAFEIHDLPGGFLRVRIETPAPDALAGDDVVEFHHDPVARLRVLIVADRVDERLKSALQALDDLIDLDGARRVGAAEWRRVEDYDVAILSGVEETQPLPAGRYLLLDSYAPALFPRLGARLRDVEVVRQGAGGVVLKGIDLRNLSVSEAREVAAGGEDTVILEGTTGALISVGRRDDVAFVHAAFSPYPSNSSLVLLPAWPLFLHDALSALAPRRAPALDGFAAAGGAITARGALPAVDGLTVESADGEWLRFSYRGPDATYAVPAARGRFAADVGGRREHFCVQGIDPTFSDLRRRFAAEEAPALGRPRTADKPSAAHWFILAVLLLLVLEWTTFSRGWTR